MKAHSNYHAKEIIDKILSLNRKGYHQAKIAKELGISPATIRYQLTKHAFESVKHIKIKAS
jgi:orotate phosphoribosyltransferase-like protein